MQKEDNKFVPSAILEGMVSIRSLLAGQKNGCNDRKILEILYNSERKDKISKEIAFLTHEGERQGFSVLPCTEEEINALAIGSSHGGIVAKCTDRYIPPLSDENQKSIAPRGFYVMIEGIEDPYNFGYALRSLYALGVDGIILPERNWLTAAGVVARSSAGASEMFRFFRSDAENAVHFFKQQGYTVVCADGNTSNCLESTEFPYPIFLIVGGEKRGISAKIMKEADKIVAISYGRSDFHASLSAASATTILAYEIAKQNRL